MLQEDQDAVAIWQVRENVPLRVIVRVTVGLVADARVYSSIWLELTTFYRDSIVTARQLDVNEIAALDPI
jgi:hypothetical protein